MRILTVARWYPGHDDPGRGSFVADLTAALRDQGADVRVASWEFAHYTPRTTEATLERARDAWSTAIARPDAMNTPIRWGAGVPVARLPALYIAGETVRQRIDGHAALLVPFGRALHRRWPIDVIHAHTAVPDGAAALELARSIGVPVMVTEHDRSLRQRLRDSEDEREAYRRVLDEAGTVAAVSAQFRDLLTRQLGLEREAIDVVANPIPAAFFAGRLDAERDRDELIYVGGRKEDKGIVTLLEAFGRVHSQRPQLHLRLVGRSPSDDDETRWRAMAEELGIVDAVRFDPPADRDAVRMAMARAAVFVHPSPFESFGVVAAEALASGLPVAATRSGVQEIVGEDGRYGEIAEGVDPGSLAEAVLRVVDRRDGYDGPALRDAASRFEASRVAQDHLARYEGLIAGGRPRRSVPGVEADQSDPDARRAPEPEPRNGIRSILVVGQNAVLAERRLRRLPAALREHVVLATRRPGASLQDLAGRLVELDPAAAFKHLLEGRGSLAGVSPARRLTRALPGLGPATERRRLKRDREEVLVELLEAQVEEAWKVANPGDRVDSILLAMDVEDVAAARRVLARGTPLAPGLTRWLADRWDASGRSVADRGSDA